MNDENKSLAIIPFKDMQAMAQIMTKTGMFGKTYEQTLALMLIAQAEGKHPAIAVQEYDIIKGKPALNSRAALARFQTAGGKINYTTRTDKECTAVFSHPQSADVTITWTWEMATQAGLTTKVNSDGSPNNWIKYPRQMLSARVVAEGVRACYPACLSGMYTIEEMQDIVTIDAGIVQPERSTSQLSKSESSQTVSPKEYTTNREAPSLLTTITDLGNRIKAINENPKLTPELRKQFHYDLGHCKNALEQISTVVKMETLLANSVETSEDRQIDFQTGEIKDAFKTTIDREIKVMQKEIF